MDCAAPDKRRASGRIALEMFLNEYVDDRLHRGVASNLSTTGLYVHRVVGARALRVGRDSRFVQLEFELPGTREVIWARGEIRHDELDLPTSDAGLVHGTGIHLVAIARPHLQLLRDFVVATRRQQVQDVLELMRKNRYH
jgi:hypothetical protein